MSESSVNFSPQQKKTFAEKLKSFLQALEAVKEDYTCGVCRELCKNPVTLSKCFHIICSEHFEELEACPTCNVSLEGSKTFYDERLGPAIEAAKELEERVTSIPDVAKTLKQIDGENISKKTKGKKAAPSSSTEADTVKAITAKGDTVKPSTAKHGTVKAATAKPDSVKPTTAKPDTVKPTTAKPDTVKPSTVKPDTVKPTAKPDTVKPEKVKAPSDRTKNVNKSDANTSLLSNISFNKAIEKRNTKGETKLHIACRLGKIDTIRDLLNLGANINTKDNAGWTPLHEVVQNGRLDLVKLLLQYNALINVPGPSNETPLHEAVRYKHEDIVEELVKNGADIDIRNCKGETPYQLANTEMKNLIRCASDHIVQTQSVNISHISALYSELDFDDIHIYCVSAYRSVHSLLKHLAKNHSNVTVEASFTKKVTHLIVDAEDGICLSSVEVLQAVMNSLWVLSTEWVTKSTDKKLQPFEEHEVKGIGNNTCQGPKNARFNKYRQLPGLFNGCHFYLHNFTGKYEISRALVVTKAILTKLITDAGGVVLRRVPNPESIPEQEKLVPYHAQKGGKLYNCSHYIIFRDKYEPMYNMQHLKALPVAWLISCMEKYELCDP